MQDRRKIEQIRIMTESEKYPRLKEKKIEKKI